ncbi:hypothetical protein MTO96_030338, partial [Rhipicephalus appendiculatus]
PIILVWTSMVVRWSAAAVHACLPSDAALRFDFPKSRVNTGVIGRDLALGDFDDQVVVE